MSLGKNPKRITLQTGTPGKDAAGGSTTVWVDWKRPWAKVAPLSGNERRATDHGGQVVEARTEFVIHYQPGVDESMRVSYAGKFYNIRHVKDINEAHEYLVLTCDTGVNDG